MYKLDQIADFQVKIEPLKKSKKSLDITNCEQLGLAKNFCNIQPRRAKCANNNYCSVCNKQYVLCE